jgi:hypothetical protein
VRAAVEIGCDDSGEGRDESSGKVVGDGDDG